MGNRAVITTKENFDNDGIGIYLHWNGGVESVASFLKYCELKNYRKPEEDTYGWAYLTNVITNFFGSGLSCGVGRVSELDCDNWDNGTYFIKDWKIVGNMYGDSNASFDVDIDTLRENMEILDERMPKEMRLTEEEKSRLN